MRASARGLPTGGAGPRPLAGRAKPRPDGRRRGAQGARCLTWSTRRAGAGASTPSWQVAPRLQGVGGGEESEEPATAIRAAGRPGRGRGGGAADVSRETRWPASACGARLPRSAGGRFARRRESGGEWRGPAGRIIGCGVRSRYSRRHLRAGRLAISRWMASRPRAALARTDYQGKDEREDCADDGRPASTAPPRKRTVHPASIASGNTPQERGGLVDRGRGFRSAGKGAQTELPGQGRGGRLDAGRSER